MKPLVTSEREAARLAALRSCAILDTRREPDFDALAEMAAEVAGADEAVLAFVDEARWWPKATFGRAAGVLPRADVFCQSTFEHGEALVIDDLASYDDRPRIPEVTHGARFYAALPLVVEGGWSVGVLCVAASVPRTLRPPQLAALRHVARQAVRLLSFRRQATLLAEAHEALAISEAQYRLLALTAPDAIVTVDEAGHIQFANAATTRLFGYATTELVGQPFSILLPASARPEFEQLFVERVQLEGRPLRLEGVRVAGARRDGSLLELEVSCGEGFSGAQRFFTGVLRDSSDRQRAERALVEAREQAEQASRMKSDFLANMSHEIRTPMNGILGMLDLLVSDSLAPSQRAKVELARQSAEALLSIINDILDLSKIEAGHLEIEPAWVDLGLVAAEVAALLRPLATAKGLALDLVCGAGIPARVFVDGGRVRQVLTNLAGNAVKFTDQGRVRIVLAATARGAAHATLRLAVEDTGIGIPADQIGLVFEKFRQLDSAATRRAGGTGLGLSICKELATALGGRITVVSDAGRGSTFALELDLPCAYDEAVPVALPAAPPPTVESEHSQEPVDPSGPTSSLRVLLVEDNPVNQQYAVAVLQSIGCKVVVAANGRQAVECVTDARPDAILMDCQMPVMDGYEATRQMRAAGVRVPIVALTANALEADRRRCLDAGMDDVLVKPIRPEALRAAVLSLAPPKRAASGDSAPPATVSVDVDEVLGRVGGDRSLFRDICHLFEEHSPSMLAAFDEALESRDAIATAAAAHRLKGSMSTFTQGPPYAAASRAEALAVEGDLESVRQQAPGLHAHVRELGRVLHEAAASVMTEVSR